MPRKRALFLISAVIAFPLTAAEDITVPMHAVSAEGVGALLGNVTIAQAEHGLLFTPALTGLPPGAHGFHVHENPSCAPSLDADSGGAAMAAGAHYDPENADVHGSAFTAGHLGDLPILLVDEQGRAEQPVFAPRLQREDLDRRSLVIHAAGDNYADVPLPSGGGGARIACGVISDTAKPAPVSE